MAGEYPAIEPLRGTTTGQRHGLEINCNQIGLRADGQGAGVAIQCRRTAGRGFQIQRLPGVLARIGEHGASLVPEPLTVLEGS